MAPACAAASAVGTAGRKDAANALRWLKRFAAVKPSVLPAAAGAASVDPATKKITFKGRYTNFSLQHIWEKYDYLQTHLLLREVIYSQLARNPSLMDLEINAGLTPTLYTRLPEGLLSNMQRTNTDLQCPAQKTNSMGTSQSSCHH